MNKVNKELIIGIFNTQQHNKYVQTEKKINELIHFKKYDEIENIGNNFYVFPHYKKSEVNEYVKDAYYYIVYDVQQKQLTYLDGDIKEDDNE